VDPRERADALATWLAPALFKIGRGLVDGLSRIAGVSLVAHPGKLARRKGSAPEEILIAFCAGEQGYLAVPHLALVVTRAQLHARVAVRASADRGGIIRRTLEREAANLARKGRPFRALRSYCEWDFEELPEIAPAHSASFWMELAGALAPGRNGAGSIDVGVAWSAEEARSLAIGDVLGAYRDLAPLYKLLANAR
jgi:hypothetical protein